MAVLGINWQPLERVAPATAETTASEGDAATPASDVAKPRLEKPLWVYVVADGDAEAIEKIDKIALDPDKVRVGSNYFRCVKVTPENAAKDPLLSANGSETPRFVFISVDYDVVEVLEGKEISGSKVFTAMAKAAKKSFKGNYEKNVKALIKVLNEFDKIADERKVLEEKEAKGLKDAEAKKIAKEKDELETRQKQADEQKKGLLELEVLAA